MFRTGLVISVCLLAASQACARQESVAKVLSSGQIATFGIAPAESFREIEFTIDDVDDARFIVTIETDLSWTRLITPLGQEITLAAPGSATNFGVRSRRTIMTVPDEGPGLPTFNAVIDAYVLPADAPRGTYRLRVGPAVGNFLGLAGVARMTLDSPLALAVDVGPANSSQGSPIIVNAFVINDEARVTDATVLATIKAASTPATAAPVVLPLLDNGVAPDAQAGDGVYTGTYTPVWTGQTIFRVRATGQHDVWTGTQNVRMDYVRDAMASVNVRPFDARFIRPAPPVPPAPPAPPGPIAITDAAIDSQPDGLVDFVEIRFPVNVITAGQYILNVRVEGAGRTAEASFGGDLNAGQQTVAARLMPREVFLSRIDGPFVVTGATLTLRTDEGDVVADELRNLSYTLTSVTSKFDFQRPVFSVTGQPTEALVGTIDPQGNVQPPYTGLNIAVPLGAAFAGTYDFTAALAGHECTLYFAHVRGQFTITNPIDIYTLVLPFSGQDIGEDGINGPYRVMTLEINGVGGPDGAGTPGPANGTRFRGGLRWETAAHNAQDFVGYAPMADCNANGIPDYCELRADPGMLDRNRNIVLDACEVRGCNPADIADADGLTAFNGGGPDGSLDNGDFSAFFAAFFADAPDCLGASRSRRPCSAADIANSDGEVHPAWPLYGGPEGMRGGGPDGALDNGDFQAFFTYFFQGCGLSGPSGQGGIEGGGGELMSRILSLLGEGEESIGGINLGALPPAVIAQRIEMLRSLGRPITVEDFKAVAPELFAPPESPDR